MKIASIIFIFVLLIITVVVSFKSVHKKRYFALYVLSGALAYFICCIIGIYYAPFHLEVNWFSISVSSFGGAPGVAFLYAMKYLV